MHLGGDASPTPGSVGRVLVARDVAAPPWRAGGARGRVRRRHAAGAHRDRRAERHREVHAAADPGGAGAARRGRGRAVAGHHDGRLPAAGARRPARRDPARVPGPADRGGGGERRPRRRHPRHGRGPRVDRGVQRRRSSTSSPSAATTSTAAPARCSPRWGSPPTGSTSRWATCPAARRRARRWPPSSCRGRTCSCSTSPPTTSTSPASSCSSSSSRRRRRPSSPSPTTGRSSTRS